MFGWTARRRREGELRAQAERLVREHGVASALAVAVQQSYDALEDPKARAEAQALRSAIKRLAGLGSLDTATRYLVSTLQEDGPDRG